MMFFTFCAVQGNNIEHDLNCLFHAHTFLNFFAGFPPTTNIVSKFLTTTLPLAPISLLRHEERIMTHVGIQTESSIVSP